MANNVDKATSSPWIAGAWVSNPENLHFKGPGVECDVEAEDMSEQARYLRALAPVLSKLTEGMSPPNAIEKVDVETVLLQAIRRIELANTEGNPILSAWLPDARQALQQLQADQG